MCSIRGIPEIQKPKTQKSKRQAYTNMQVADGKCADQGGSDRRWWAPTVLYVSCSCQELIELPGRAMGVLQRSGSTLGTVGACVESKRLYGLLDFIIFCKNRSSFLSFKTPGGRFDLFQMSSAARGASDVIDVMRGDSGAGHRRPQRKRVKTTRAIESMQQDDDMD